MRTKNQSRLNLLLAIVLPVALMLSIVAASAVEFSRLVSIQGGTPAQRLSVALGNAGYTGGSAMDEMSLCVPSANANTMYIGSASNVDATTGFPLAPGDCITYRAAGRPIEASSFFIFVATTESLAVTLRPR